LLTLGMNALERAAKKRLGQHEGARGVLRSRSAAPALADGSAK
ncbi:ectoine/hydroxyectoine ABC transporter permease subunit EhuC, partial [Streptomyces sp. SID11233]|nr:ectoine/hydroxyectoine ABC transporter permease subunit EhuC [Streptomyces sp. SID11233]